MNEVRYVKLATGEVVKADVTYRETPNTFGLPAETVIIDSMTQVQDELVRTSTGAIAKKPTKPFTPQKKAAWQPPANRKERRRSAALARKAPRRPLPR